MLIHRIGGDVSCIVHSVDNLMKITTFWLFTEFEQMCPVAQGQQVNCFECCHYYIVLDKVPYGKLTKSL